ncbi:MAG: DUF3822 family protein [Pedobacter sp.]|jgi:hypothetical protein
MIKLLHLVDDGFQSQTAAKCDLLIHIGIETLQYAIIDKVRDELKALAEYKLPAIQDLSDLIRTLEKLPESNREFKYPYNKVKISFDSYKFTFIPAELYENENDQEYAKFINQSSADLVLTNTINSANIKNLFAINSDFLTSLNQVFQNPKIFNQASSFIEGIKKNYSNNNSACLIVDCYSKHIQIACLKNSELVFYNIFECLNADEFNYFLLNTIETLNLDTEATHVIISGKVTSDEDEYYQRLLKYFNKLTFADSRLIVRHSGIFDNVSPQTYFSLISLDLCE